MVVIKQTLGLGKAFESSREAEGEERAMDAVFWRPVKRSGPALVLQLPVRPSQVASGTGKKLGLK